MTRIGEQTGIGKSALSRFVSGERSLPATKLEALAEWFKLELRQRKGR